MSRLIAENGSATDQELPAREDRGQPRTATIEWLSTTA
jgi:hypothetical protein